MRPFGYDLFGVLNASKQESKKAAIIARRLDHSLLEAERPSNSLCVFRTLVASQVRRVMDLELSPVTDKTPKKAGIHNRIEDG